MEIENPALCPKLSLPPRGRGFGERSEPCHGAPPPRKPWRVPDSEPGEPGEGGCLGLLRRQARPLDALRAFISVAHSVICNRNWVSGNQVLPLTLIPFPAPRRKGLKKKKKSGLSLRSGNRDYGKGPIRPTDSGGMANISPRGAPTSRPSLNIPFPSVSRGAVCERKAFISAVNCEASPSLSAQKHL